MGGNLIASLGLGLGLALDLSIWAGLGINAADVVIIFSRCFLDIFSYLSTLLNLAMDINSPVERFDKMEIILQRREKV